jgi:hypothetical protein
MIDDDTQPEISKVACMDFWGEMDLPGTKEVKWKRAMVKERAKRARAIVPEISKVACGECLITVV